ncbi:MAG: maleylpyruvate isomerase family mycothiol-dependent enzyme [Acidimicrobiales bacterium]
MLDASSISVVLAVYRPERTALVSLLEGLTPGDWSRRTECPAYPVKGVATHVLGDDLSLLSRQRDDARNGLALLAEELPGADFRTLLDTFNDRWVAAASFLSNELLLKLLRLSGECTAAYYERVDPATPGESVGLFGAAQGGTSPFWQAIAREYLERWIHHSQIRRALGIGSLADRRFLEPGVQVAGAIARMEPDIPTGSGGNWSLGPLLLGSDQQTADILTRAMTPQEIRGLVGGPTDIVEQFAAVAGRP